MDEILGKILKDNSQVVFKFRLTLSKETDRGCALMAAAFLENELEKVLRERLIGTASFVDQLFEFNGAIGTFSSKIKMSYSLGLISKDVMIDLDIIRKIRNDFGHDFNPIDFNTPSIKSRIDNLKGTTYFKQEATPRQIFNNTVLFNLAFIHSELGRKKFTEKESINISVKTKTAINQYVDQLTKGIIELVLKSNRTDMETNSENDESKSKTI